MRKPKATKVDHAAENAVLKDRVKVLEVSLRNTQEKYFETDAILRRAASEKIALEEKVKILTGAVKFCEASNRDLANSRAKLKRIVDAIVDQL